MGYAIDHRRVIVTVMVSEKEQAALLKKRLEELGIIYSVGEKEVCYSIVPESLEGHRDRIKEYLHRSLGAPC